RVRSIMTLWVDTYADSPKLTTQTGRLSRFASAACRYAGIVPQSGEPVPHTGEPPNTNTLYEPAPHAAPGVRRMPPSSMLIVAPVRGALPHPKSARSAPFRLNLIPRQYCVAQVLPR